MQAGEVQHRSPKFTVLRHARRGHTLPIRGLHQVSPVGWNMHLARRGQALPARGVLQVFTWRRHTSLQLPWWGHEMPARGLHQGSRSSSRQCVLHAMPQARAAPRCVGRCVAPTTLLFSLSCGFRFIRFWCVRWASGGAGWVYGRAHMRAECAEGAAAKQEDIKVVKEEVRGNPPSHLPIPLIQHPPSAPLPGESSRSRWACGHARQPSRFSHEEGARGTLCPES